MRITLRNYKTNELTEIDSDSLTDELARQLIGQDQDTQAIYGHERRAGASVTEAMNRANLSRFDTHGRR